MRSSEDALKGGQVTLGTDAAGGRRVPRNAVVVGHRDRGVRGRRGCGGRDADSRLARPRRLIRRNALDRRRRQGRQGRQPDVDGQPTGTEALDVLGRQQAPHFVQRPVQHEDVVLGQQECGDLGQLSDGRALGVGHDVAQGVQRRVEVVHPPSLAAIHLQSQLLQLVVVVASRRPPSSVTDRRWTDAGPLQWRRRRSGRGVHTAMSLPCRRRRRLDHCNAVVCLLQLRQHHRRSIQRRRVSHDQQSVFHTQLREKQLRLIFALSRTSARY